jgi:aldehyde dehydrogenase (NAD+)
VGEIVFEAIELRSQGGRGDVLILRLRKTEAKRSLQMAMPQTITATRHDYANGEFKRMLIGGEWVKAASGKAFESRNPATGDLLATVAEGDAEDINRAVAAARRAFEGPWSKMKPYERQQLLLKLADLVENHFDELSMLDTLDMGAPISRTRATRRRVLGMART